MNISTEKIWLLCMFILWTLLSSDILKANYLVSLIFFVCVYYDIYAQFDIGFKIILLSANTGGLLGLFLGFSFLSFVEIMYFMSLRLICAYYRHCPKPNNNNVYPFSQ